MASDVDICNIALGHLGDSATVSSIDPPEGSSQAEHCARFYPIARDLILQAHAWGFATTRKQLAFVQTPIQPNPYWLTIYAQPSDCVKPLAVLPPGGYDTEGQNFDVEADENGSLRILCNVDQAILRYVRRVTDPTKFTPLFTDALTWLLASYLAGPIIKGDAGAAQAKECLAVYRTQVSAAAVADMQARKVDTGYQDHRPSWIAARGGVSGLDRNRFGR